MTIEEVKRAYEAKLMALKGVEGVGIGADQSGNPAILIYTSDPSIESHLPRRLGDYPVRIESLGGPIRAYPKR